MKTYNRQSLRLVFSGALLYCSAALFSPVHAQSIDPDSPAVDPTDQFNDPVANPVADPVDLPVIVPGHLVNVSIRAWAGTGDNSAVLGIVVNGSDPKQLMIRGVGPSLANFGVTNFLPDPVIVSFDGQIYGNTGSDWDSGEDADVTTLSSMFAQVGAFALAPQSTDVAFVSTLDPNAYTMNLTSAAGDSGVALAELYDLDGPDATSQIVNFSGRARVGTGDHVLIAGFTIAGDTAQTMLIRGIGPSLSQFGVGGVLANPQVSIYDSTGTLVAQNNGWNGDPVLESTFSQVGAFDLPANSSDAALVVTLAPGSYSVQVSGANGTTGHALAEVYLVQQ
jgi:hypothetical protein